MRHCVRECLSWLSVNRQLNEVFTFGLSMSLPQMNAIFSHQVKINL